MSRSHVKVKHFDFPLSWVSKYNNLEKAAFWNVDTVEDRFDMIRDARDGGSVNPEFHKRLMRRVRDGQVQLLTLSTVTEAKYVVGSEESGSEQEEEIGGRQSGGGGWTIKGQTRVRKRSIDDDDDDDYGSEPWQVTDVDYLVSSTGSELALDRLECVRPIVDRYPIDQVGGLPCLTTDLAWSRDVPLFFLGAYSMLEVSRSHSPYLRIVVIFLVTGYVFPFARTLKKLTHTLSLSLGPARTRRVEPERVSERCRTRRAQVGSTRHL